MSDRQPPVAQTSIPALKMARALRGSLENGCEINLRDLDILIEAIEETQGKLIAAAFSAGRAKERLAQLEGQRDE